MPSKPETKNFKFTQHKTCEYFPCHKVENTNEFNCLFCYCPLYLLKEHCGGNFKYTNEIKDCSDCTLPHSKKNGYDFVMSKMNLVTKLAKK